MDLAGLSEHLKLSLTDTVLQEVAKMIMYYLLKIWFLVIQEIMDAMEVTLTMLGTICTIKVL